MQTKPVDPAVHEKLMALFRTFLVVGGMPHAVDAYLATQSISEVVKLQRAILVEYKKDASKYDKEHRLQIGKTIELLPEELNKKNKRFVVADLEKGQRYGRVEDSFTWLEEAGIALPVRAVNDPHLPLRLSRNSAFFKLFMNDVGLLAALYMDNVQYRILSQKTDVNFGAVYENFVAQELTAHGYVPYYFRANNGACEVDFLLENDGRVLPIEVKSGKNYKTHASLDNLLAKRDYGLAEAVALSNANVSRSADGKVRYLPVYALMFLHRPSVPDRIELPSVPTLDDVVFKD